MTDDLRPPVSHGSDPHTCNDEGQMSVGSKDKVEKDRRMDRGDCIACHANIVAVVWSQVRLVPQAPVEPLV